MCSNIELPPPHPFLLLPLSPLIPSPSPKNLLKNAPKNSACVYCDHRKEEGDGSPHVWPADTLPAPSAGNGGNGGNDGGGDSKGDDEGVDDSMATLSTLSAQQRAQAEQDLAQVQAMRLRLGQGHYGSVIRVPGGAGEGVAEWSCSMCTSHNDGSFLCCGVCGSLRSTTNAGGSGGSGGSGGDVDAQGGGWSCQACR